MDGQGFAWLVPDDTYLVALDQDIWLMDDHRWALIAWERLAREHGVGPYTLVHADYHRDAINDFHENEAQRDRLLAADVSELQMMVEEGNWIRYDSFIAPAVLRGLVTQLHFFCLQDDDEPGLDEALLRSTGARQTIHRDARSLAHLDPDMPVIFDLCLGLFNPRTRYLAASYGLTLRSMISSDRCGISSNGLRSLPSRFRLAILAMKLIRVVLRLTSCRCSGAGDRMPGSEPDRAQRSIRPWRSCAVPRLNLPFTPLTTTFVDGQTFAVVMFDRRLHPYISYN